jgi:hypothetical protein
MGKIFGPKRGEERGGDCRKLSIVELTVVLLVG